MYDPATWAVLMAKREPNGRLRTLLNDARWSGQDFARAVNGVAAETGLTLRYDRTSVSHWLSGTRPSAHVVALAAEALSRRTGRRISPADTGLARAAPGPGGSRRPPVGTGGGAPGAAGGTTAGAPAAPYGSGPGAAPGPAGLAGGPSGEVPVYSRAWRPPGNRRPLPRPRGSRRGPGSNTIRSRRPRPCCRCSGTPTWRTAAAASARH